MDTTDITSRLAALLALVDTSTAATEVIEKITHYIAQGEEAVRCETEQRTVAAAAKQAAVRAELVELINDEKAFLAACQRHMNLRDADMRPFFRNLTSKWGEGGEDVKLAKTFLGFLADVGVSLKDLVFSHPQWSGDLYWLSTGEKGAAWYGTMNHYCRALLRHLSGKDIQSVSHPEAEELTDEEVKAMSKDEFFDLLLFSGFQPYPRGGDDMNLKKIRGEYWGKGFVFHLYRYPSGTFAALITNPPG